MAQGFYRTPTVVRSTMSAVAWSGNAPEPSDGTAFYGFKGKTAAR